MNSKEGETSGDLETRMLLPWASKCPLETLHYIDTQVHLPSHLTTCFHVLEVIATAILVLGYAVNIGDQR